MRIIAFGTAGKIWSDGKGLNSWFPFPSLCAPAGVGSATSGPSLLAQR